MHLVKIQPGRDFVYTVNIKCVLLHDLLQTPVTLVLVQRGKTERENRGNLIKVGQ